jgi:hypothetical protein
MLRYSLAVLAGLWAASVCCAGTWADRLFDELAKDFGSVPRGPTLTHHFRLVNNTNGPVSVAGVRVSCGCTTATVLKSRLAPGEETYLVARMDTSRFIGPRTVTIFVTFSEPSFDEVRLWVQANSRSDFQVAPDGLSFGQVKRGSTPAASVVITFYGSAAAQVIEVHSDSNYIRPVVKELRRSDAEVAYELSARLRGDLPVGKWYTDIWLKTNNPSMPQVRVPLTVEVESALTVSPEAVALGPVKAGGEVERRVIVRGVQPFRIVRIDGGDDVLSVRDSAQDARAVHVLTVHLKAGQPGDLRRSLRIHTDLPQEGDIDLGVTGQVMP